MKARHLVFMWVPTLLLLVMAEFVSSFFSSKHSVFWANPMMMQYPVQAFDTEVTQKKLNFSADPNRVVHYVPDPMRWYRLDPEPLVPSTGKLVLHLGDSSTWGWGIDCRYAYSSVLNNFLPEGVHSVNLGVPGYTSLQGLRYLEILLNEYEGRIVAVTLYFGNNDGVENGGSDRDRLEAMAGQGWTINVARWLEEHSAFFRVSQQISSRVSTSESSVPRVSPEEYRVNLQRMIELCKKHDIKVILIEPPVHLSWPPGHLTHVRSLKNDVKNAWARAELRKSQELYQQGLVIVGMRHDDSYETFLREAVERDWVMSRLKEPWRRMLKDLENEGVDMIHLSSPFIEAEFPWWFVDYCHPSERVHRLIAKEIANKLAF